MPRDRLAQQRAELEPVDRDVLAELDPARDLRVARGLAAVALLQRRERLAHPARLGELERRLGLPAVRQRERALDAHRVQHGRRQPAPVHHGVGRHAAFGRVCAREHGL